MKSLVEEFLPPNDYLARTTDPLKGVVIDTAILIWAAWNLDSAVVAFRGYELAKPNGDKNIFGSKFEAVEISAISGVFRSCATALDLCGTFVSALVDGESPRPEAMHSGLRYWDQRRIENEAPPLFDDWLADLRGSDDWNELQRFRDNVSHRTLRRHMTVGAEPRSALSIEKDEERQGFEEVGPRLIRFSGGQFEEFLEATRQAVKG